LIIQFTTTATSVTGIINQSYIVVYCTFTYADGSCGRTFFSGVCLSVCLSVCLLFRTISQKSMQLQCMITKLHI